MKRFELHDLAVRIRQQGPGRGKTKLLIVIDQFEQWLNVNDGEPQTMLGETLRQCDGVTLQALLLVRDDFTLAITRFLEELEEPLLQNRNFAAIDLFSMATRQRSWSRSGGRTGLGKESLRAKINGSLTRPCKSSPKGDASCRCSLPLWPKWSRSGRGPRRRSASLAACKASRSSSSSSGWWVRGATPKFASNCRP